MFRNTIALAFTLFIGSTAAFADTVHVKVNGMVCAFCCEGIEKAFKKCPEMESIKVDLKTKLVTLYTKPGRSLDDKTIRKIVTDAGYTVAKINREESKERAPIAQSE